MYIPEAFWFETRFKGVYKDEKDMNAIREAVELIPHGEEGEVCENEEIPYCLIMAADCTEVTNIEEPSGHRLRSEAASFKNNFNPAIKYGTVVTADGFCVFFSAPFGGKCTEAYPIAMFFKALSKCGWYKDLKLYKQRPVCVVAFLDRGFILFARRCGSFS